MNAPSPIASSSRLARPTFLVVSAILLVAGVALMAAVQDLKLHFKKEPVPQPRDFHELPAVMGNWLQISQDDKLDKETEDVLGTDQYLYRDYLQVDRAGAALLSYVARSPDAPGASTPPSESGDEEDLISKFDSASFDRKVAMIQNALKGKTPSERKEITYAVEVQHPGDIVHMGLTYYTGLVDTVAHIPDRCYIADGYEPASYEEPTWSFAPDASGKAQSPLRVRFISFEDQTGNDRVPKCVAYVFHANGHYDSDPLGVRQTLQDLTQRYGYYAKIELMTIGSLTQSPEERRLSASAAMNEFLSAARPRIETCFPDWNKVIRSHP